MMTDDSRHDARSTVATLYTEYGARMFHYALAVLERLDDAEEVMQDVFVSVARRPKRVTRAASPRAYLFAMLRNEMTRFLKRRRRRAQKESGDANTCVPFLLATEGEGVCGDDDGEVERALRGLPGEQREVIVLKVYEGLTFREIADVMRTSANTAASRYRYALAALRRSLARTLGEDQ